MVLDLTALDHLNAPVPTTAKWWECQTCGDYAWVWPGEDTPACSCEDADA